RTAVVRLSETPSAFVAHPDLLDVGLRLLVAALPAAAAPPGTAGGSGLGGGGGGAGGRGGGGEGGGGGPRGGARRGPAPPPPSAAGADVTVGNAAGHEVLALRGVTLADAAERLVPAHRRAALAARLHAVRWQPARSPEPDPALATPGRWLLCAPAGGALAEEV